MRRPSRTDGAAAVAFRMVLGGEDGTIGLTVTGRHRLAQVDDPFGIDWLAGSVDICLRGLRVERTVAVRSEDLMCFAAELDDCVTLLLGRAGFATLDDSLHLEVTMRTLGRATVTGTLQAEDGADRYDLTFSFASDQTFLSAALRQLAALIEAHPARALRNASDRAGGLP